LFDPEVVKATNALNKANAGAAKDLDKAKTDLLADGAAGKAYDDKRKLFIADLGDVTDKMKLWLAVDKTGDKYTDVAFGSSLGMKF